MPPAPRTRASLHAPPGRAAWLAMALGLSPVLADLARHALQSPGAAPALGFALLLAVRVVRAAPERPRAPRAGLALAAAAAAAGLLLAAAGAIRFARPAIPLAALGLCLRTGRPPLREVGLALFAVPLPAFAQRDPGAWLAAAVAGLAAPDAAGAAALHPVDGGLALAWTTAGCGYWLALRRGAAPRGLARAALLGAGVGLVLQAVLLAAALPWLGAARHGLVLHALPGMLCLLLAVVAAEVSARRAARRAPRAA